MNLRRPRGPAARGELPLSHLLPNLMTVAAIVAGLTAIRFGLHGHFVLAVQLIIVAGVLDGLDGRLARLLRSESALGAELDSLADFLNFGVAPALVLYMWGFQAISDQGWIAAVVYAVCCVLRLARFNVGNKAQPGESSKRFFTGVPAPAGALLALLPMFVAFAVGSGPTVLLGEVAALWLVVVGLLMISRVPTFSMKSATIHRENIRLFLIASVVVVTLLLSFPWITLAVLDGAYFLAIFWSWRVGRRAAVRQGG